MATFNGAAYIEDQLRSIFAQLSPGDEVVMVDDASTDDTVARARALGDPRLQVREFTVNRGYAAAFEDALSSASGDVLLLSDQDDVWTPGRVASMRAALEDAMVVAGDLALLGTNAPLPGPYGQAVWRLPVDARRRTRILVGLFASNVPYFGSAMGLRRTALDLVLPFPTSARELPDAWIAITGLLNHSIVHLDEIVVLRRIHERNASGRRRRWSRVAVGRLLFLRMVAEAMRRRRTGSD